MYTTCSELVIFMYLTRNSMNNLLSYCGLVDARISASDKDLPVRFETSKAKQLHCSSSPFQKDEHTAYPGVKQKPFMQSSVNATSASSFNSGLQSSNFQVSSSK